MTDIPVYASYMYSYPHKTAYRTFNPEPGIAPFIASLGKKPASLYFHIPFCRHKCGFCNLFSQQGYQTDRVTAYLAAMRREAVQLSAITGNLSFDAFAIGGGTPLVLDLPQFQELFDIALLFGVDTRKVFTSVETSPHYTDPALLAFLKDKGVARLSIGIQSFDDGELRNIRRTADAGLCRSALDTITTIGFSQLNLDLIYGIEGQTVKSFLRSLRTALSYHPTELFLYPLYVRQGTRINTRTGHAEGLEMYFAACAELLQNGFTQTSMRRFVKQPGTNPEFSCGDETMISCGCGGRSYIGDLHFSEQYATEQHKIAHILGQYVQTSDFTKARNGYLLNDDEKKRRFIIKNLMYYMGVDKTEYAKRFQGQSPEEYPVFATLISEGMVTTVGNRLKLTETGMAYSDYVGQLFISPEVREQMTNKEVR